MLTFVASMASAQTGERWRVLESVTRSRFVARTVYSQRAKTALMSADELSNCPAPEKLPPASPAGSSWAMPGVTATRPAAAAAAAQAAS